MKKRKNFLMLQEKKVMNRSCTYIIETKKAQVLTRVVANVGF